MRAIVVPLVLLVTAAASPGQAQQTPAWNDPRVAALIEQATTLRGRQLADTGLRDYRATAHGYVLFLAQLGEGLTQPPKVVKADELVDHVYWVAPAFTKQFIEGRRDTLLLPTDIIYHRDHLGIVQNNFPRTIRVGDGDEVRDVPHPLSPSGRALYDFAIVDSLRTRLPDQTINVYKVLVRPHDDHTAGIVGAIYIEPRSAQVVRMTFSFTRAAYREAELEDISIVLENGLVGGRFWLPRRQTIEIRRRGSWLDLPARGIIQARWDICCYVINTGIDVTSLARGWDIDSAPHTGRNPYPWTGSILDSLPSGVGIATNADVQAVENNARALIRPSSLSHGGTFSLAAHSISDFIRSDRVEGFALGAGGSFRPVTSFSASAFGRYGFDDKQGHGHLDLLWQRPDGVGLGVTAYRDFRDAGDEPETSRLINSFASQEFGSDRTDPFDVRGVGVFATAQRAGGLILRVGVRRETESALAIHARSALGHFAPTIPAEGLWQSAVTLDIDRPTFDGPLGTEIRATLAARYEWNSATINQQVGRIAASTEIDRTIGRDNLRTQTTIGFLSRGSFPIQDAIYLGGPVTGPGYDYHAFVGALAGSEHVEWQFPIPGPAVTLGRYGTTPRRITLAPFAHVVYLDRPDPIPLRTSLTGEGLYPSLGMGVLAFWDVLRFDVARGLRDGRWTFSFDLTRDLWSIL
jgi:hypothetical protein